MTTDPLREGLERLVTAFDGLGVPVRQLRVLLAETAPAAEADWDEVGGAMWFDRHQWGVIIDGLILQRAEAEARKATNEYSNSDERAAMCVDLIERINAADGLATPPPAPVAGVELCALCQRPATGLASICDQHYCHGDADIPPTCYEVVQWRHSQPVTLANLLTPRVPFDRSMPGVEVTEEIWREARCRARMAITGSGAHRGQCRFPDTDCSCGLGDFRNAARLAVSAALTPEAGE